MIVSRKKYFELIEKFDIVPFTQTQQWLEHQGYCDVVFFVDDEAQPLVGGWGVITLRKVLGKKLIIHGICRKEDVTANHLRLFFKSILEEGFDIVNISDIDLYNSDFELGIRRAGFVRPIALSLCPMTIVVDLQSPFRFHRNWKRAVKKSIETGHVFEAVSNPTSADVETFISLFDSLKERKQLGFSLTTNSIERLLKGPYKLFFMCNENGQRLCARIVYVHNGDAYDVYAANSNEGIKTGAVYHIQESILNYLKQIGCNTFDYGRISPSADYMDAIYLSKSFSGGRVVTYNGEWTWFRSKPINFIYALYLFVVKNKRIY